MTLQPEPNSNGDLSGHLQSSIVALSFCLGRVSFWSLKCTSNIHCSFKGTKQKQKQTIHCVLVAINVLLLMVNTTSDVDALSSKALWFCIHVLIIECAFLCWSLLFFILFLFFCNSLVEVNLSKYHVSDTSVFSKWSCTAWSESWMT